MSTCSFEGCDKPPKSSKQPLCTGHYYQQRRGQELRPLRKKISKAEAERLRAQGLKRCSDCDQVKPLEDFARHKSRKDGRQHQCKACEAEYYQANRERRREYFRQYREANRERKLEYERQYREANREKYREYFRQYYEANRERKQEYFRQWYEANREQKLEYDRQWAKDNPDKVRAKAALRRARELEATTEEFTPEDLVRIWGPSPDCVYGCGRPAEHWDHFVPLKLGGHHAVYNLFPACAPCNLRKSDKHPYLFLFELMVEEEQAAFVAALEARVANEETANRRCKQCGDPAEVGNLCDFCAEFTH